MKLGLGISINKNRGVSAAGFTSEYQSVLDYGDSQAYTLPSASVQGYQNDLVASLISSGIWNLLDVLYVYATDGDQDMAATNWKNPGTYNCSIDVGATFTSLEGFTGNGTSTGKLSTTYVPRSNGVNYTDISASAGYYSRTSGFVYSGAEDGVNDLFLPFISGGDNFYKINSSGAIIQNSMSPGFVLLNRKSVNPLVQLYNNGVEIANGTTSVTNTPNAAVTVLNVSSSRSLEQVSCFFLGADLSDKQFEFFTAIEAYMDAIGKGVVA